MASLIKRGKYYYIVFWNPDKKRNEHLSLKTGDKSVATAMLKEWKRNREKQKNEYWLRKAHTISSGYEYYRDNCGLKMGSLRITDRIVGKVIEWLGDKPINRINREDYDLINRNIRNWVSEQRYGNLRREVNPPKPNLISKHTQRMYAAHLISVFNFFISREWIDKHYIERPKTPPVEVEDIPADHLRLIFEKCANDEHKAIFKFLLITGRRAGELAQIRTKDIDMAHKAIKLYVQKSDKKVVLPIIAELEQIIVPRLKREYLFYSRSYWAIRSAWERLMRKCGFHYTLHQLRKSCATYLFSIGIDLRLISIYLTHSDVKVTQKHYTRLVREGMMREIEEKADFSEYIGEKVQKVIPLVTGA